MRLNQVLVVYKQAPRDNALHYSTLNELYAVLKELGIPFDMVSSRHLTSRLEADLVITVGGDGTVLAASHFIDDVPILGVKSFGKKSVGYFCAVTKKDMRRYIADVVNGKKRPIRLHRLKVTINRQTLAELALNDILFSSALPASTSRYKLCVRGKKEEQKSSGVWVSTSAGSTAAIKAAGGRVLPITSDKMEYLVREPYTAGKRYGLTKGVLPPHARVKIVSMMRDGTVFIDGGSTQYPAPAGAQVEISSAGRPLKMFWR